MTDTLSATLLRKAEKERGKSGFKPARRLFLRAARAAQHPLLLAQAWQGAADCARLLGDFPASVHDYGLALKAAPPKDKALRTDLACGEALAWRGAGEPKKALRGLAAALTSYTNLGDFQGQAFCHWALGGAWRIAGDLPKALAALTSAEKAYRRLKQPEGLAYVHCALGGVQRMLGNESLSLAYYQNANQAMRLRKDLFGTAYSYCGLGNAARMRGDLDTALKFFTKAERVYARIGDRVSFAYTLWSMATTYKLQGLDGKASAAFKKSEKLFTATGDRRGLAYVALGFSELEALRGKNKLSLNKLSQAAQLARGFAWETRHVRALSAIVRERPSTAYARSGSRFKPSSLPVNWP